MRDEAARLARALEWIARLPLCGEPELAGLLGVDEYDARRLIHLLSAQGWVETVAAASPELEPRRLAVLRGAAVPALAAACGRDLASLADAVPVRPRDLSWRVARLEITACVDRFVADLAGDLESSGIAQLADARSLPLALPRAERWWLPDTEGYGCLRSGPIHAPFLVAWDRAAAPDYHRRRRLAGWFAASARTARRWGKEGLPPVLVICPSARERRVWEEALAKRDGAGSGCLDLLLTTREELHAAGAGDARWWRPGRAPAPLVEQLGWGAAPVARAIQVARALEDCGPPPRRTGASLSRRARASAMGGEAKPAWRRLGDLALATGPAEKTLTEWVARHPLLSAAELAALTDESGELTGRRLERLASCGAIGVDDESVGVDRNADDHHEARYLLTDLGMRWLAARAGVPPAIFARRGGVTFAPASPPFPRRVVPHREHTLGINRFTARLALDARAAGWRLAEWRNEAESTRRFVAGHGRTAWIRPDGSGVLERDAESRPFLLEYDRGTLHSGSYRAKFEGYRHYYAAREWEHDFPCEPALLFVCCDSRAAARVWRAVDEWAAHVRVFATTEWRFEGDAAHVRGLFGDIWQPLGAAGGARQFAVRVGPDLRRPAARRRGRRRLTFRARIETGS